jgi:hypothetical protein
VLADALEDVVTEAVMAALDGPALADAIARTTAGDVSDDALAAIATDEAKLIEMAEMWDAGEITRPEWISLRERVDARLADNRAKLASRAPSPLTAIDGPLRDIWPDLSLDQRAAVIGAVVVAVKVARSAGGARFRPERVSIVWRV